MNSCAEEVENAAKGLKCEFKNDKDKNLKKKPIILPQSVWSFLSLKNCFKMIMEKLPRYPAERRLQSSDKCREFLVPCTLESYVAASVRVFFCKGLKQSPNLPLLRDKSVWSYSRSRPGRIARLWHFRNHTASRSLEHRIEDFLTEKNKFNLKNRGKR